MISKIFYRKRYTFLLLLMMYSITTIHAQIQIGQDIIGGISGDSGDLLGFSTDISSDGSIIAIGAPGGQFGYVSVYENISGNWVQIGNDINDETIGDLSGYSLSLSSDGSIIAIGAINASGINGFNTGHVRVFENVSGNWVQIGQNIDGEDQVDQLGFSTDISSDGSIVAISSPGNDDNGINSGNVRIFENVSGNWVQIGQDIDGEAVSDRSGRALSLSSDGSVVAIGAFLNDGNGDDSGHVRVFENVSGNWVQIGNDIDGEAMDDLLGRSLSLSSDGSIIAISSSGRVQVYENVSDSWVQIGQDIEGSGLGRSVSLSFDGNIIAISAFGNNNSGLVRLYQNVSDNWVNIGNDINGDEEGDQLGRSLSLSSDGFTLIVGAPENVSDGSGLGYVRVFSLEELLSINDIDLSTLTLYPNPASKTVILDNPQNMDLDSVAIYDITGRLVQEIDSNNEIVMDISHLENATYLVTINSKENTLTKKLVINN